MVKSRTRRPPPVYPSPSPEPQLSSPWSALDDTSASSSPLSTPSTTGWSRSIMATRPPTLTEILLDNSPPPWTLTAFMAYLSQNHCMETLEFTLDSQRYATIYDQLAAQDPPSPESTRHVCCWWEKLIQIYIVPCAPREVNIPSRVRDRLLSLPHGPSPPHPSELEEAGRIIYELMNDSLLLPFLQSVAPLQLASPTEDHSRSPRRRSRNSRHDRASGYSTPASDSDGLTDDSDSNSPPAMEPMTPPTTPPTSEYTFNTSPGGFQRAVAAHSKGWKKVGAKLGFNRKASSRRSTPTSSGIEYESPLPDTSHGHSS